MRVPFHSLVLQSAFLAAVTFPLLTSPAYAEFLDDLFGDDPAPAPRSSASSGSHRQSDYSSSRANRSPSSRHISGDQSRRHANNQATVSQSDETKADGDEKDAKLDLCTDQGAKKEVSQKADAYLFDKDLKHGDSVMTSNGVLVFKGHSACPHKPEEFVALSSANAPKGNKKALVTIDAAAKAHWQ